MWHRYSWVLESLVALVYGCGFIVMTPQLFINWRLKSVAHLPWKFFMYKASLFTLCCSSAAAAAAAVLVLGRFSAASRPLPFLHCPTSP